MRPVPGAHLAASSVSVPPAPNWATPGSSSPNQRKRKLCLGNILLFRLKSDSRPSRLETGPPHPLPQAGVPLARATGDRSAAGQSPPSPPPTKPTHLLGSSLPGTLGWVPCWWWRVPDGTCLSCATCRSLAGFFGPCSSGGSRGGLSTCPSPEQGPPSLGQLHTSEARLGLDLWPYRKQGRSLRWLRGTGFPRTLPEGPLSSRGKVCFESRQFSQECVG